MLESTSKVREQVGFVTDGGTGTIEYAVPTGKTAYLTVMCPGSSKYFRVNSVDMYVPTDATTEMKFVSGAVIASGNGAIYFSGHVE